ncbi:MAG: histidinol dehydrogenase [Treponema sp.]|jgi:histidinol dehydrogenase|nr:histidinol dehydrogenase [Treponema sp.]
MKIITGAEFDSRREILSSRQDDEDVNAAVRKIIAAVRAEGDAALRRYASQFDRGSPENPEVPAAALEAAGEKLLRDDPELAGALALASDHIRRFSLEQKRQLAGFEYEMAPGLITGQRVIPVERAAVYAPAGRFPLVSTVLMGLLPAFCAGVEETLLASPPMEDGLPDRRILAAAGIARAAMGVACGGEAAAPPDAAPAGPRLRVFAIGGAQAIAALALGTESVPRCDVIAGPGNRYVAAAKRLLFGEAGIDFVAGPTDVLIIADGSAVSAGAAADRSVPAADKAADLAAADMLAQAEHDPDARARLLVPNRELAEKTLAALERRLAGLSTAAIARASLDAGALAVVYKDRDEAIRIANRIAPEHLELQVKDAEEWIPRLKNYGSLFIGALSAEALGDYSAGINHTLPTSGSARFTGGLSVRHFLKTATTLRCAPGAGLEEARRAAEIIARAEGLAGHAESAALRAGAAHGTGSGQGL